MKELLTADELLRWAFDGLEQIAAGQFSRPDESLTRIVVHVDDILLFSLSVLALLADRSGDEGYEMELYNTAATLRDLAYLEQEEGGDSVLVPIDNFKTLLTGVLEYGSN